MTTYIITTSPFNENLLKLICSQLHCFVIIGKLKFVAAITLYRKIQIQIFQDVIQLYWKYRGF